MYYIGVDLGGTNIATAAVSPSGEILGRGHIPTPRGDDTSALVADAISQAVLSAVKDAELSLSDATAIGIGTPGTIDPENGVILYWSNLDFHNIPLVSMLQERLPVTLPIYLENDANAAALGEYVAGAGKNSHSMLAITLGTGVGGGAILNDKLFTGYNYGAMEIGHLVIQADGIPCTCGRNGCFESYCSATALIRDTKTAMEQNPDSSLWQICEGDISRVNGRVPFDAALLGDITAKDVVSRYIAYLGSGITSLINILQPESICIGGGIAYQGDVLLAPLQAIIDREDYCRANTLRTHVVCAKLGNDAGIIGAAFLPKFK